MILQTHLAAYALLILQTSAIIAPLSAIIVALHHKVAIALGLSELLLFHHQTNSLQAAVLRAVLRLLLNQQSVTQEFAMTLAKVALIARVQL